MTPATIDSDVEMLVSRIAPAGKPVYLDIEPEKYAIEKECFPAVAEKIHRDGGTQVLGWQIWKGNMLVEGEFHAVWQSPEGTLHDITPKPRGITRILFLPDPTATYDGASIDNVRINISGNAIADDFILACETLFRLHNHGERAYQQNVHLVDEEAELHELLVQLRNGTYAMVQQGANEDSPCPCRSEKSYRSCHGDYMKRLFASLS